MLLPSALEIFPHHPYTLLDITTSLAAADQQSAAKVISDLLCIKMMQIKIKVK